MTETADCVVIISWRQQGLYGHPVPHAIILQFRTHFNYRPGEFMSKDLLPWHEDWPRRVLVKICAANSTPGNFNDYLSRTAYLWSCDVFDAQVLTSVET